MERKLVVVLIFDKVYFKAKSLTRNKEGLFKTIKDSVHEEGAVLNVNALNNLAPNMLKQYGQKMSRHFKKEGIQMPYRRK